MNQDEPKAKKGNACTNRKQWCGNGPHSPEKNGGEKSQCDTKLRRYDLRKRSLMIVRRMCDPQKVVEGTPDRGDQNDCEFIAANCRRQCWS